MAVTLTTRGTPLHEADLAALERQLGTRLPDAYREFLLARNVAVPEANQFRAKSLRLSVTHFFGISQEEGDDLSTQNRVYYAGRLPPGVLAVGAAAGGNLICLNPANGAVYFWDHEQEAAEGETPNFDNMQRLALSFSEFLEKLEPLRAEEVTLDQKNVVSVKLKPGFAEKFKRHM